MGLIRAKRLLLVLAEEKTLFLCLRRKEALMYVSWDQLLQLLILIVSIITLFCVLRRNKK